MGGKQTQTTDSNSFTQNEPWWAAKPALFQALAATHGQWDQVPLSPAEDTAYGQLAANAQGGNEYAPAIGALATDLLGGGVDRTNMVSAAYEDLKQGLTPYTTASTNPWDNAEFRTMVDTMSGDVMDRVKSAYVGAGYAPAGAGDFAKSAGEGIAKAVAPVAWQAGNDLDTRRMGAINTLYGAGNTTAGILGGMDQTALTNRQAGVGVASAAKQAQDSPWTRLIEVENQRRSTPLNRLAAMQNLIVPVARLGGTAATNAHSTTTSSSTPGLGQIIGAGLGLAGMAFGGPGGGLLGGLAGLGSGWGGGWGAGAPMNLTPPAAIPSYSLPYNGRGVY